VGIKLRGVKLMAGFHYQLLYKRTPPILRSVEEKGRKEMIEIEERKKKCR